MTEMMMTKNNSGANTAVWNADASVNTKKQANNIALLILSVITAFMLGHAVGRRRIKGLITYI